MADWLPNLSAWAKGKTLIIGADANEDLYQSQYIATMPFLPGLHLFPPPNMPTVAKMRSWIQAQILKADDWDKGQKDYIILIDEQPYIEKPFQNGAVVHITNA